jgi:endoribonuclease Dicer
VLDYLITRYIYEDPRTHYSAVIHELRAALVNNSIFASWAVKNSFHEYINYSSERIRSSLNNYADFEANQNEYYTSWDRKESLINGVEDVEPPKILADVFESVAGAIYLDSGRKLDAVWMVYNRMMQSKINEYSKNVPKSPISELQEMFPRKVKFWKPEKITNGNFAASKGAFQGKFMVFVEVHDVGTYKGIGNDEKQAKCTAAKFALHIIRKTPDIIPKENPASTDKTSCRNPSKSEGNLSVHIFRVIYQSYFLLSN